MGRIVISENVSLDGVVEIADDERGDWYTRVSDRDRAAWAKVEFEEAVAAAALLMGRRSYEWFVERGWADRAGEWADRLRELPKYVVASTALERPDWPNATVVTMADIAAVKRQVSGDIVVYGSGRLARALLAHDLVDELRLMTYPVVVGAGTRLFGETDAVRAVRLVDTRTVGDGIALLTYHKS